jgi:hypothetical protein
MEGDFYFLQSESGTNHCTDHVTTTAMGLKMKEPMNSAIIICVICVHFAVARVVQEVPFEEYFMNYKQVKDCDNPMVDGSCPLLGGPYRLPNL